MKELRTTGATTSPVNYTTSVSGATERWIGKESACSSNNFNGSISEIIAVNADLTANEDIQINLI